MNTSDRKIETVGGYRTTDWVDQMFSVCNQVKRCNNCKNVKSADNSNAGTYHSYDNDYEDCYDTDGSGEGAPWDWEIAKRRGNAFEAKKFKRFSNDKKKRMKSKIGYL